MDVKSNWKINLLSAGGILPTVAVSAVTAWVSYGHIVAVAEAEGEQASHLIPVSVDGMMFASTALMAVDRLRGNRARPWAIFGLWLGSVMTLAFNVYSAWERGLAAMIIAAIPAIAMIVCIEAVFHPSQRAARVIVDRVREVLAPEQAPQPVQAPVQPTPAPVPVVAPIVPAEPVAASTESAPADLSAVAALNGFVGTPPSGVGTVKRARRKPAPKVVVETAEEALPAPEPAQV